jgi:hypothetical protein
MAKRHAPRRPRPTKDPADAVRCLTAKWTLVQKLYHDPRVVRAGDSWFGTPGARRCVAQVLTAPDDKTAADVWRRERPAAAAALLEAIRPVSGRWLGEWLADACLLEVLEFVTGQQRVVQFRTTRAMKTRAQRLPKNGGSSIERDVQWFYRARVKQSPDSVSRLAREYIGDKERTNARSVVQDGIKRAAILLDLK